MRPRAHAAPGGGADCGPPSAGRPPPAAWPSPQPPASYAPRPAAAASALPRPPELRSLSERAAPGALWTPSALSSAPRSPGQSPAPRGSAAAFPERPPWEVEEGVGVPPHFLENTLPHSRSTRQPAESATLRQLIFLGGGRGEGAFLLFNSLTSSTALLCDFYVILMYFSFSIVISGVWQFLPAWGEKVYTHTVHIARVCTQCTKMMEWLIIQKDI